MSGASQRPRHPRDRARTHQEILDAAEHLIAVHGTAASIAAVAKEAGVSKSGLLHHFPSRDALLIAVAERGLRTLVEEVDQHLDPSDTLPGRGTRAYVRALCGGSVAAAAVFSPTSLLNALLEVPGTKPLLRADAAYWHRFFAGDGLPAERYLVIRHAAEGLAASSAVDPYLTADELDIARNALLDLTVLPDK